jgi:RHH-type proline utilization regulon transcriptional repressor/proline dehydrogenase/delta 1-pyrroline-5-carboxylate dehydrogenase
MDIEQDAIREKGLEIFRLMDEGAPEVFDTGTWIGRLMNHAMADPDLKVRLFRFVDVLPSLKSPEQVVSHIREYFLEEGAHLPAFLKKLLAGIESGLAATVAAELVRRNIVSFSRTFIAGATPEEALGALERLWRQGNTFTVDILGEAALSEKEAEEYHARYLTLIAFLSGQLAGWPVRDAERERTFPRLNVSVKVSSL